MKRSSFAATLFGLPFALLVAALCGSCHWVFNGELAAIECSDEGAYGAPACPPLHTCLAGRCVAGQRPLGAPCEAPNDCAAPAFCLDPTHIGKAGEPRCSIGCCSSADCGPASAGQVCWPGPDAAGSVCFAAEQLGRGEAGKASAGAYCNDDDECRSALCDSDLCIDVCCSDTTCAKGTHCQVRDWPGGDAPDGWMCAPTQAPHGPGEPCDADEECITGRCIALGEPPAGNGRVCAEACCNSRDCGREKVDGESVALACAPVPPDGDYNACWRARPNGASGEIGVSCDDEDDCLSGICVSGKGENFCSDICCGDADCGDANRFVCRPVADPNNSPSDGPNGWGLRCVLK